MFRSHRFTWALILIFATALVGCTLPGAPATPVAGQPPVNTAGADTSVLPTPEVGAVTVASARPVSEVVADNEPYIATISPDGKQIAWFNQTGNGADLVGRICLFTFESAAKNCFNLPAEKFLDYPYALQWSPDGKRIAFTENPIQLGDDPDLWVMNVSDGAYSNLTDDGVTGAWDFQQAGGKANVDYLPMWNSADGQLYFWRVVPLGSGNYKLGIFKVAPEGGTPTEVRDLTAAFPKQLPVFDYQRFMMDGPSAISPDGKELAAILAVFNETGGNSANLWTIDLQQTDAAPRQLMTFEDFQKALPQWASFPAKPTGLSWTADSNGIVAVGVSLDQPQLPFMPFYYVARDGSSVKPVVDFSGLAESEAYFEPTSNGVPMRGYSPWTGSLSPKGDKLVMLNDLGGKMALLSAPLPPTSSLPSIAATSQTSLSNDITRSSRSTGDKIVMYGIVMTVGEP